MPNGYELNKNLDVDFEWHNILSKSYNSKQHKFSWNIWCVLCFRVSFAVFSKQTVYCSAVSPVVYFQKYSMQKAHSHDDVKK